ncbi:aldo/keto reductase [Olivibacter sp. SDN3]|uniref:aldo/keto reductase n=1 Tax=Olivibacter sp. SDN3 TaxID=2764720 RepID=UPI001650E93B|nr:aldo/keto reductase [Olivibacter sp. SDN3]QNL49335.1 aldo/keto reductase [Olivibacter sp. SDN3]
MHLPPLVYGTSSLGNLYEYIDEKTKHEIIAACIKQRDWQPVFDSAGKYGAGLALEVLGRSLKKLKIKQEDVVISNKLGWYRIPLQSKEPSFEKGVWKNIQHDAIQKISYDGILECFEQGNDLLQGYKPGMVSVHDPDEFLARASCVKEEELRLKKILQAYQALESLKMRGEVTSIGIGAKNWRIIQKISSLIKLDWVMIANSLTIHRHPKALLTFVKELRKNGAKIINSAVFNGGFLTGGNYYNYLYVDGQSDSGRVLHTWRKLFFEQCHTFNINPAAACIYYGLHLPGISSIALNTSKSANVTHNINAVQTIIAPAFWEALLKKGLITSMPCLPQ